MASVDKLLKSLENLKVFQADTDEPLSPSVTKKKQEPLGTKDKVSNFHSLCECIISNVVRTVPEFPNYLGVVLEVLLSYTNDKESDVRMVADECLNKITKTLLDTNLGRLQVEYYKELKKNGPSRCVRSALWRFAELAPLIRLQKRRAFVVNLHSCIVKMAERHEEALQEGLMSAMSSICPTLMKFATDAEVKGYLAPFITNLCSTSAVVRRVASTCTTLIAQSSGKPLYMFNWLLLQVLDLVLPIMHVPSADNVPIMCGCLHCIRLIIPFLTELISSNDVHPKSNREPSVEIKADTSIMLFELIIHCMQQTNPTVNTAALECFQQLLKTPLPGFINVVLTPGSLTASVLAKSYEETLAAKDEVVSASQDEIKLEDNDSTAGLEDLAVNLTLKGSSEELAKNSPEPTVGTGLPSSESTHSLNSKQDTYDTAGDAETVDQNENASPRRSPDSGDLSSDSSTLLGSLTDPDRPPLLYSVRLLCHSFLLTGGTEGDVNGLYADRDVRVSIKSLALNCVSHAVLYYPACLNQTLFLEYSGEGQKLSDVLLYSKHSDPQIQGSIASVLGNLIPAHIYADLGQDKQHSNTLAYINQLEGLLSTDNSVAVRLVLSAVKNCLDSVNRSCYIQQGLVLMESALKHKAHNYWLVKVMLLELVSEVDMTPLVWLAGSQLQSHIRDNVVLYLLGDSDYRVRQAASAALVKLIRQLFYSSDNPLQSIPLNQVKRQVEDLMYPFLSDYPSQCPPLVHGLSGSYDQPPNSHLTDTEHVIQSTVSRVVHTLIDMFSCSSSPHVKLGVCHTLYELSEAYPVSKYPAAWGCAPGLSCVKSKPSPSTLTTTTTSSLRSLMVMDEFKLGSAGGPLTLVMSLLTQSPLSLDLSVHEHLLALAGNLLSGACISALKQGRTVAGTQDKLWSGIYDRLIVPIADKLLTHICKLLNIYSHIMEDNSPIVTTNPKAVLDAAKEAITSPIKKRVSGKPEAELPTEPKNAKEAEKVVKSKKEIMGSFNQLPFYMKLYESVKGAHHNYKVTLSLSTLDKFNSLINTVLQVLCQLLEVASLLDIGKCTEELLDYLKVVITVSPVATITAVHQLLKALFGTNLSSQYEELVEKKVVSRSKDMMSSSNAVINKPGLFTSCLSTPYAELTQSLAHNPFRHEVDDCHNAVYIIKKCQERKLPAVLKPDSGVDKNTVGAYIRLFEQLVIKSIKMYTVSSSITLQEQVLSLLVQLIQLRVNYCLLDNDEVFLKYVLKQIDLISEGPPSEYSGLIRCIFQFLLLLSYEKLHSKTLVTVPRIIQLCDGVMASGQDPATHAIPALEMLVKDLFLSRSLTTASTPDTAFHDIETQREVAASMLLKLISYQKVLGLMSIVLYQTMRENEDKWKKLSRQVIDLLLPLATRQQLETETEEGYQALNNILLAVSPSVYRPVDMILKAMFTQPQSLQSRVQFKRWMSTVLALLRILLLIGKEEVILSRLNEIEIMFDPGHMTSSTGGLMSESYDSLIASSYGSIPPQEVLASFLIQLISLCTSKLTLEMRCAHIPVDVYRFSVQQLSSLLLYTSYILQSGHFKKVAKFVMEQLTTEISLFHHQFSLINDHMILAGSRWPVLTIQWCNILSLLNCNNQGWWKHILCTKLHNNSEDEEDPSCIALNKSIVQSAGLAVYCDYVMENLHDAEHLTWLIINHVNDLIEHIHEAPVRDLMGAIYSNPSASGLFISAVHSRYDLPHRPSTIQNVLLCLKNMHKDQSGPLLVLLVDKLLNASHTCISRMCESLACRRVEVLLAEDKEAVYKELSQEDIMRIMVTLSSQKQKYRRLICLIEKLRSAYYPTCTLPDHVDTALNTAESHKADKRFYLHICKMVCTASDSMPSLCVSLLGALETQEIINIMELPGFQLKCLAECIKQGYQKSMRIDTGTFISHKEDSLLDSELSPLFTACETILSRLWKEAKAMSVADLTGSTDDLLTSVSAKPAVSLDLMKATIAYLHEWNECERRLSAEDLTAICHIAALGLIQMSPDVPSADTQGTVHTPDQPPQDGFISRHLHSSLELLYHVLRIPALSSVLATDNTQLSALLRALLSIILAAIGCRNHLIKSDLVAKLSTVVLESENNRIVQKLVICLADGHIDEADLHPSLTDVIKSVIIGVSRLPSLNRCARMPSGDFYASTVTLNSSDSCELRAESLQDTHVLKQFIKRNNILGWISKKQFEETWACLLYLLSPVAVPGAENVSQEEDVENIEWMVSALRGITGHLCLTLRHPVPGNTLYNGYKHSPRHTPIATFHNNKIGQRLYHLRKYLDRKSAGHSDTYDQVNLLCDNLERTGSSYFYNQLSVDYLTTQISKNILTPELSLSSLEKADTEYSEKEKTFSFIPGTAASLHQPVDTASCLKLLIDVFTHLLSPNAQPSTPLMLTNECVRSIIILSDIFQEKSQYEWMFRTLLEVYFSHHNGEDDLTNQYAVLGLCKSASIIQIDSSNEDKLQKVIELSLKSNHIPTRLAGINGCMYLLEANNDADLIKSLLPIITDFITRTLDVLQSKTVVLSEVHTLCFWSLAFYFIEHNLDHVRSIAGLLQKVVQVAIQYVTNCDSMITPRVCSAILSGFERLLLTNSIGEQEANAFLKLASERLTLPSIQAPVNSVLGLLLTCLYAQLSARYSSSAATNEQVAEDPEISIHRMEIISVLFDRIRRGLPQEAELVTGILPPLMADLFTSQDIMNKVIGEFLTEQQSHPTLMARMIYEVFEQQQSLLGNSGLLQDWVLLSLTSFTQRKPLSTAIWSLNCFFLCASTNIWLKGLFPFLASRTGILEQVDEQLFLLSSQDFYNSLTEETQKKQFLSAFQSAARTEAIYKQVLSLVN